MGAGVVEIDGLGFIKTHSFHTFHVHADATLAEVYAFDCALQLIEEKGSAERHFNVYTDHANVYKWFVEELQVMTNDLYIDGIKKRVALLKKFTKFEILLKNDSVDTYAHYAFKTVVFV